MLYLLDAAIVEETARWGILHLRTDDHLGVGRDVPLLWADSGWSLSSTLCDLVGPENHWPIFQKTSISEIPVLVGVHYGKTGPGLVQKEIH